MKMIWILMTLMIFYLDNDDFDDDFVDDFDVFDDDFDEFDDEFDDNLDDDDYILFARQALLALTDSHLLWWEAVPSSPQVTVMMMMMTIVTIITIMGHSEWKNRSKYSSPQK